MSLQCPSDRSNFCIVRLAYSTFCVFLVVSFLFLEQARKSGSLELCDSVFCSVVLEGPYKHKNKSKNFPIR